MRSSDNSHTDRALKDQNVAGQNPAAALDTTQHLDTQYLDTQNLDEEETTLLHPTRTLQSGDASLAGAPVHQAPPHLHAPAAAGLRTVLAMLLALLSVLCALAATSGTWVNANLASERGFSQFSSALAEDRQLAAKIADGAVEDLMKSEGMTAFLDGTKASGLYSILVKPSVDGLRTTLNRAAGELSTTEEYRSLWREIAEETRRYNLSHDGPAVIVLTPFYRALDAKIGSIGPFDPDLTKIGPETLSIDRLKDGADQNSAQDSSWVIHPQIKRIAALGQATGTLTVVVALGLLVAVLVAPRHRVLVPVASALIYAVACWTLASWLGTQNPASLGVSSRSAAGTALIDGIWAVASPSLISHLGAAASYGVVVAVILLLAAILMHLLRLGRTPASGATVITH